MRLTTSPILGLGGPTMPRMSDRLEVFGDAVARAMERRGVGVRELGRRVGVAHSAVAAWLAGASEPGPPTVFTVERELGVAPGSLSRHLGYVPVEALKTSVPAGVPDLLWCIRETLELDARDKRILLVVATELLAPRRRRR